MCTVCNNENCNCQIFHKETLDRVKNNLISDEDIKTVSDFFKVMGNFSRIKIIKALQDEELCVCDIGTLVGITKSAVSHQMRVLRKYDLITSRKEGKMVYYKLKDKNIINIINDVLNTYGGIHEENS